MTRFAALPLTVLALLLPAGAASAPGDLFTAGIGPASVKPSLAHSFTLTVTSAGTSAPANHAQIAVPAGFAVNELSVNAATSTADTCSAAVWAADPLPPGGPLDVRSPAGAENELCPGGTLTVSFSASAPAAEGLAEWTTALFGADPFAITSVQPTMTVDGTPPDTTLTGPSSSVPSTSASFSFTSTETASTFECKLDSGSFETCDSPRQLTGLEEGTHTFEVRASDGAGNTDASPDSRTWTVDTIAPETFLDSIHPTLTNQTDISFGFSASELNPTFECSLDGAAPTPCVSPAPYLGLGEGAHTFRVWAADVAGNADATSAAHTWTIDVTAPVTSITDGPADPTNQTSATFVFAAEGAASYQCRLDSGAWTGCTSPQAYTGLADGPRSFAVRATDAAGNTEEPPATFDWTIDTVAPAGTIDGGPSGTVTRRGATFQFSSSDSTATFKCSLDGEAFAPCTSPHGLTAGLGGHSFRVAAVDPAGNVDTSPGERLWTVANPALSVGDATVTEGNSGTVSASFTVGLSAASDQTVTVDYATAGGSATTGADFQAAAGTLTFAPEETSKTVTVSVKGDALDEIDETFSVGLSTPVNATLGDASGLGTITDDDPEPALSIGDVTIAEGQTGSANAVFTVSLNAPSSREIDVAYATANGSATAPADYTAGGGTLNFAPGETTEQVVVPVHGDVLDEADDTFAVNLSAPLHATIADGTGLGTITDDDALPALSVNDVSVTEGNSGTTNAVFTVNLSPQSGRDVTVDYATGNGLPARPPTTWQRTER